MFQAVAEFFGVEEILGLSTKELLVDTRRIRGPGIHKSGFLGRNSGDLNAHYFVLGKVGEGAFGTVCTLAHKKYKRQAVCKAICKETTQDENMVRNEIAILQSLDHPNIVRLFEYFETDKAFLIVFEHLPAGDLQQEMHNCSGGMKVRRVAHYMRQVLLAINYCHSLQVPVLHRDLKPANVMKLSRGAWSDVKIIDYGLSVMTAQGQSKKVCGTPVFMAPEAFEGKHSQAVDLWGVGMMTYYMLVKDLPFENAQGREPDELSLLVRRIRPGHFPMHQGWDKRKLRSARDLLARLLRQDPRERFTAAQALNSDFIRDNTSPSSFPLRFGLFQGGPSKKLLQGLHDYVSAPPPPVLRIALLMAACKMDQSKMEKMKRHFETIDRDCDGYVSARDLADLLSRGGRGRKPMAAAQAAEVLKMVDLNADGKIGFSEFVAAWLYGRLGKHQDCLKHAFEMMDTDGDGVVSQVDILNGVSSCECLTAPLEGRAQEVARIFPRTPMHYQDFVAHLMRSRFAGSHGESQLPAVRRAVTVPTLAGLLTVPGLGQNRFVEARREPAAERKARVAQTWSGIARTWL